MLRNFEQMLENFYSIGLNVSQFFPEFSSNYALRLKNSEQEMKVLVLGSYQPGIKKLIEMYEQGEPEPNKKLTREEKLLPTERILFIKGILEHAGYKVLLGNKDLRSIRNVWNRLEDLIEQADHIIILLRNYGGILVEHTRIIEKNQGHKTVNYVENGEKLSNVLLQGSFLLPQTKVLWYKDDLGLADLVIRTTEAYYMEFLKRR